MLLKEFHLLTSNGVAMEMRSSGRHVTQLRWAIIAGIKFVLSLTHRGFIQ